MVIFSGGMTGMDGACYKVFMDNELLMNDTAMYMFDPELNPKIRKVGVMSR